jgi:membrane protein implicated in regulation of membrane protease activity
MAVFWLVLGVILLLVELRHMAFYALFAAVASFAAAVVALVAPSAVPLQLVVAVVAAAAGVVAVRPAVSRAFPHRLGGQVARGVHGGLVGQEALTLDNVGSPHVRGHVRMTGERWLAVSGGGTPIPAATPVIVTAVEGTTLVVWPLDAPPLAAPNGPQGDQAGELESGRPDGLPPDGADGRTP